MRIRIRSRRKIQADTVMLYLAMFCVFSFAFLEHVSITIPMFSMVKLPMLYLGGLCMVKRLPFILGNVRRKRYFYVILVLVMFCMLLAASDFVNRNPAIGTGSTKYTIRLLLFLVELYALMIWISETGRADEAIAFLFRYLLLIVVVTDVLFFTGIKTFYSGRHEIFLIGTKFTVSYYHMDLLTLWFIRNNMRLYREGKSKRMVLLAIPFMLAVSLRVDCMTGVIGCLALFTFFMMMNTRLQRYFLQFSSPVWLVIFLTCSVMFPFLAQKIVSIPFVTYLVEGVLSRSTTLTGRMYIFETFLRKSWGHLVWGFGLSNGNLVSEKFFNCANAQNALLQWTLEVGVLATGMMVVLMVMIFRQLSKSPRQRRIMPMVVLLYVYIILGMVETTFNMTVMMWIALIFMQVNAKNTQQNVPAQQ